MRRIWNVLAAGCCLLLAAGWALAANTGGYRGPQNNGVYPATDLLRQWPDGGPKLLWKQKIGDGWSGVTVVDDTVFTSGGQTGQLFAFSLDGLLKYKLPFGSCIWKRYGGTRTTPLVFDDTAVASTPSANVVALDLKTGERKWELNAWKTFGSGKGTQGWGYPETPVLAGDLVVFNTCSRDDDTPPFIAVNKYTGQKVWAADAGKGKKYSAADVSGSSFRHGGREFVVYPSWRYVTCMDAKTGNTVWEIPNLGEKTLTPVYQDGYLLVGLSDKVAMLKLSADGQSYTALWTRPFGGFGHAVILNGQVFMFGGNADVPDKHPSLGGQPAGDGAGEESEDPDAAPAPPRSRSKNVPSLLCVDAETGDLLQSQPRVGPEGHIVAADGMVYVVESGRSKRAPLVSLLRPTAQGFAVAGSFTPNLDPEDVEGVKEYDYQVNVHPTIAEGRLFLRYGSLLVYDLRAEQPSYGWRADGTGHAPNANPPLRWSRTENLQWVARLPGTGGSSPVVSGDNVLITCEPATLACVDAASGRVLWQKRNTYADARSRRREPRAPAGLGNASPTPIVREGRVYTAFNSGVVACYDLDGNRQWITTVEPAAGPQPMVSPLLSEHVLVVQGRALQGLDVATGTPLWSAPVPAPGKYGRPAKTRLDGTNILLTGWGSIIRAADGKALAEGLPQLAESTPVVKDGVVYYAGNRMDGKGAVMAAYRLPKAAAEGMAVQRLWQQDAPAGTTFAGSPLVEDGLLYALTADWALLTVDAATGAQVYRQSLLPEDERAASRGMGNLTLAGGRIYAANLGKRNRTVIITPGRQFAQVWQYATENGCGEPAFVADRQYVRGGDRLYAIAGSTPATPQAPVAVSVAPVNVPSAAGLPVQALASDAIPDAWVVAGPIAKRDMQTDHLAALGGRTKALPKAGDVVKVGQQECRFQPLQPSQRWMEPRFTAGMNAVDITAALNRQFESTGYFFTVLENDAPRYVRFRLLTPDGISWNYTAVFEGAAWLAGQRLNEKDVYFLEKGRYPLMIQTTIGTTDEWGKVWMGPRFLDITDDFQKKQAAFQQSSANWPAYQASLQELFVLKP